MKFSPVEASERITEKYKRYLKTIFQIADKDYAEQLKAELDQPEILAKGPYLDVVDSFKRGKTIRKLIEMGVISDTFEKLNFPIDRELYLHQEEAIIKCSKGKNIVVSTGTGSGKTESFLIPILRELTKEQSEGKLTPGVRALIIYPMNALANDQIERLRNILADCPEITYGSYTGQTKQSYSKALQEYRILNGGINPKENELISREQMLQTPPHILLTNYAMLEYLMIRPKEMPLFEGKYALNWKFIVLDEAHIYNGSTGIEVSMLLRRLKSCLPKKDIQYILTSATLGSDEQDREVAEFASRLCNSVFHKENVIRAIRLKPDYESMNIKRYSLADYRNLAAAIERENEEDIQKSLKMFGIEAGADLHLDVYKQVISDKNYWDIREYLQQRPLTIYSLAEKMNCTNQEIENFVIVAAFAMKENAQLFDAKYHMFIKACDSAFVTLGKSKKLMLTRNKQIYDKAHEYAVFEMAVCTFCHAIYLIGKRNEQGYFVQMGMRDDLASKEILYLGDTVSDEDDEHSLKKENLTVEEYRLCSRCGKLMLPNANGNERCEHEAEDYVKVFRVQKKRDVLTKCVSCENVNTRGVLRQFFAGQEAVTSVLGTALFEELPSYKIVKERIITEENEFSFDEENNSYYINMREPESAKQFIAFSDSRQAAAFYASYLDQTYVAILYKRLIVETLRKKKFHGNVEQFVGYLQANFEDFHIITDESMVTEKEAWKAVLNEMVDGYANNALQNLGFFEITVDCKSCPTLTKMNLSSEDVSNIINIFLQSMMQDAAISYPVIMTQTDKEFYTYNGHEGSFTLSDSTKNTRSSSFLPSKAGGCNKRLGYIEKLFSQISPGRTRADANKLLESFWNLMVKKEFIINEGVEYKVNTKKLYLNSEAEFYQCTSCRKITPYNVKNICPTHRCNGKLKKINLADTLKDNHYYRMYQDMEIRPLRVVEHTAQLSKEKAYTYQTLFKEKKIDVLSCSTTFEMGVDVGSLETVFMRNVPPSPANYAQRAGRAGRSIHSVAYALTFCNKGNHDFTYFSQPEAMIRGKIKAPVFKVENDKIGIRHVFASALAFFWKKYPEYFSTVETMIEQEDGTISGIDCLKKYLDCSPQNLKDFLEDFLPVELIQKYDIENFGWIRRLYGENGVLTRAEKDYLYEVGILEKSYKEALSQNGKVDYLRYRINNYKKENILAFLSKKSVLPKYGFPVDTVELSIWDSKSKNKLELDLQRDLAVAISEYAPGSQIIADGHLITSQYVKRMPNMDWKQFDYVYCDCKTLNIEPHIEYHDEEHLKVCKVCGEKLDKEKIGTFIVPEFGFESGKIEKAGLIKPHRTFNSDISYIGYRNDVFYNHFQKGNRQYEIAFSQNDEMAILNRSNYYVCDVCGYTSFSNSGFKKIDPKIHKKSTGVTCNNENLRKYALGYKFDTDVIQIRFCWPQINTYEQAVSILYGIMKGTCAYLCIEENDISGCLRYFYNPIMKTGSYTIVLYDKTPGGAGHVKRLNDANIFEEVLKETRQLIAKCNCGGTLKDTACYSCLKSYSNQKVHDILQRRYVLDFLEDFFDDSLKAAKSCENISDIKYSNDDIQLLGMYKNKQGFEFEFYDFLIRFQDQITNRQRFIGLMRDILYRYPKQINLISMMYQLQIHDGIKQALVINEVFAYRYKKMLIEELGISEDNADWAAKVWCVIYGKNVLKKPCSLEINLKV